MKFVRKLLQLSYGLFLAVIVTLSHRNRRKVVFGAWMGKQYSCNPKYLFEYMVKRGGFECVWIGDENLRNQISDIKGARFARKGSFLALWHVLTAWSYVFNVKWRSDIMDIPRCKRANLIYLTHGYAAKKVGKLQLDGRGSSAIDFCSRGKLRIFLDGLTKVLYGNDAWCSESSKLGAGIRICSQQVDLTENRMLRFGKPRADYFIRNGASIDEKNSRRKEIANKLKLPLDKRWYLYAPTWRHNAQDVFSFTRMHNYAELQEVLAKQNAIIIEKQHPLILKRVSLFSKDSRLVRVLSEEDSLMIDTQELLMACDRIITDYSSIYFDYVLMNRPVIHFTYDFEHFMKVDMGFNYDIREYGGGPFAYCERDLLAVMRMTDEELMNCRSKKIVDLLEYETGVACEKYYELLVKLSSHKGYFVPAKLEMR